MFESTVGPNTTLPGVRQSLCHEYANRRDPGGAGRPEPIISNQSGGQGVVKVISELSCQGQTEHAEHQDRTTNREPGWLNIDQ